MANVTSGNPFILDTVTDSAVPTGQFLEIYAVRWASGSLADGIALTDRAGTVKWSATGTVANNVDQTLFNPPLFFNGLACTTLGSGKVYVYCKYTR